MMGGFYIQYLEGLCQRRGWHNPLYDVQSANSGFTCLVVVNGREYQTDIPYASNQLAQENAAMRAFMVCRNFSVNGGMLARNGVVQGLPASETNRRHKGRRSGKLPSRHSPSPSNSDSTSSGGYEADYYYE